MKEIRVMQAGAGGYGEMYLEAMETRGAAAGLRYVGIVEPYPAGERLERLIAAGVPVYKTVEDFYAEHEADIAVIASPIQYHKPQTLLAFQRGSHVLCEKPIAPNIEDARDMIDARNAAGRLGEVGFQWSFSGTVQNIKADIRAGRYGRPLLLKSLLLWPRDAAYYARGSGWAGKVYDHYGKLVNDSVASNATAHYLHNMLFILGDRVEMSMRPEALRAVLMRANRIENYDTCFMEARLPGGARALFTATHAVRREDALHLEAEYQFEYGVIRYEDHRFVGTLSSGERIEYGNPDDDGARKLFTLAGEVRANGHATCSFEAGLVHVQCIEAAAQSTPVFDFPAQIVHVEDAVTYAQGLPDVARRCYAENRMPEASDADWVRPGMWVEIV